MSIVLYIFQNAIILGLLFLLGGVIYAKKGRGGNTSLVGGLSMIIGVFCNWRQSKIKEGSNRNDQYSWRTRRCIWIKTVTRRPGKLKVFMRKEFGWGFWTLRHWPTLKNAEIVLPIAEQCGEIHSHMIFEYAQYPNLEYTFLGGYAKIPEKGRGEQDVIASFRSPLSV